MAVALLAACGHPAAGPARYTHTSSLVLALGEGAALGQHAAAVRLPASLAPLSPLALGLNSAANRYRTTLVVARAWAPPLTGRLLQMPAGGSLPRGQAFPVHQRVPGYAVVLGVGTHSPAVTLAPASALQGQVLAFIGEPSASASLPAHAASTVALPGGIVGYFYAVRPLPHQVSPPAVMLAWAENGDTYAIYAANYGGGSLAAQRQALTALAATMSQTHITQVVPMRRTLSLFRDTQGAWGTPSFGGVWDRWTVQLAAPGAAGYTTAGGIAYRVTRTGKTLASRRAPTWPQPTALRPVPVLEAAVPYLRASGVRVLLPADVPLQAGTWPRLNTTAGPSGYTVTIRETAVNLPPNTPYAVGLGLGQYLGRVRGSRSPLVAYNAPGLTTPDAPPVRASQITEAWLARRWAKGYYRGTVILPGGVRAELLAVMAGDGDHSTVLFREHGTYYAVSNYHSARHAVAMAASMVPVP